MRLCVVFGPSILDLKRCCHVSLNIRCLCKHYPDFRAIKHEEKQLFPSAHNHKSYRVKLPGNFLTLFRTKGKMKFVVYRQKLIGTDGCVL